MPKILSLDIEKDILKLLNTIFERAGYEHIYTTNSDEALAILNSGDIDLFTQNIIRAQPNGCEFYQLMQSDEDLHTIPMLIISSVDPLNLPQKHFNVIAPLYPDYFISMPFSKKTLLNRVKKILNISKPQPSETLVSEQ